MAEAPAALPSRAFDAVLVWDRDRIGREQIETSYILKQIITAGVRIFEVARAQEITLSSPTDKVLASVVSFASELEREQARVRTHAALLHRARAGRSVGGTCFGYTTTQTPDGQTVRTIVPAEAQVIVRAFTLAAEGHGIKAITRMLNAEGALAPRKDGRVRGWGPSTIRGLLHRTLYHGSLTWNQTRKRNDWGQRQKSRRDDVDTIRVDVPAARIVSDDLWAQAQAKLAAGRQLYEAKNGGALLVGRPSGNTARYLLSGVATCGRCGHGMFVHRRSGHQIFFGCMGRHLRGKAICDNVLETRLDDTDAAVLGAIEAQILNATVLERALHRAIHKLDPPTASTPSEGQRQLAQLEAEMARLTTAIADGGPLESLLDALRDREQRRTHLRATVAAEARQQPPSGTTPTEIVAKARRLLAEWQALLHQDTPAARRALQAVLGKNRLTFTHGPDGYAFTGIVPKGCGTRTRTIPPPLRRALQHRDKGCRFPGCGRPSVRDTTSSIGPTTGRPRSRTSRCSAVAITAPSMKTAIK